MINKKVILVVALGLLLNIACGGGGDDTLPVPATSKTFNLYYPDYFEPGYKAVYSLTGSDSYGYNYELT